MGHAAPMPLTQGTKSWTWLDLRDLSNLVEGQLISQKSQKGEYKQLLPNMSYKGPTPKQDNWARTFKTMTKRQILHPLRSMIAFKWTLMVAGASPKSQWCNLTPKSNKYALHLSFVLIGNDYLATALTKFSIFNEVGKGGIVQLYFSTSELNSYTAAQAFGELNYNICIVLN